MHNHTSSRPSRRLALPVKLAMLALGSAAATAFIRQRRRWDFFEKGVVITGASRGLGLELARAFASEGANIALLARDKEQLAEAERELRPFGVRIAALSCDITKREQVDEAVRSVAASFDIDVLVNNAGIIQVGPYENMEIEDFEQAMATHFWGPLYLTLSVVGHMRRRGGGRIVNIGSIGGKVAVPHLLPYVASKFALVGLSEALRAELAKDRIYVTTVSPGLMRTGSHLNALFKGQHKKEFALFSIANASPLLSVNSESAARQIVNACRYGVAQLVIGPQARIARFLNCLLPTVAGAAVTTIAQFLPGPSTADGSRLRRGWESRSALAPRLLTWLADRAARRNRERPQPAPERTRH